MKRIFLIISLIPMLCVGATKWRGVTNSNWYSGPKLTEDDLVGKVVLVDKWGVGCPPCRALLPMMQRYWNAFRKKNFILLGSHCQGRKDAEVEALVKEHGLTFPIYDNAGIENEPPCNGIPFLYVVNHRGKVLYSGHNHSQAIQIVQEAIIAANLPPTLMGNVDIPDNSPYRNIDKQLVLGKNIAPVIRKLEADIKNSEKRTATEDQKESAQTAKAILAAIEESRTSIPAEIESKRTSNPVEALSILKNYIKTFPKDSAELRKLVPVVVKEAAAWKKEQKAKARK